MAHGLKCYACGEVPTMDAHYLWFDCASKLNIMFNTDAAVYDEKKVAKLDNLTFAYHCIICGENEKRQVIDYWMICDQCVNQELAQYKNGNGGIQFPTL